MANLNGKLIIPDFDDDKPTKQPCTPDPIFTKCLSCNVGPSLLDSLCEPCYRKHNLATKHAALDKLIHAMSQINTDIVTHEARLSAAKMSYNKAVKQNWTCGRGCGKVFSYYGELFAHENEKACNKPRQTQKRARFDEGII